MSYALHDFVSYANSLSSFGYSLRPPTSASEVAKWAGKATLVKHGFIESARFEVLRDVTLGAWEGLLYASNGIYFPFIIVAEKPVSAIGIFEVFVIGVKYGPYYVVPFLFVAYDKGVVNLKDYTVPSEAWASEPIFAEPFFATLPDHFYLDLDKVSFENIVVPTGDVPLVFTRSVNVKYVPVEPSQPSEPSEPLEPSEPSEPLTPPQPSQPLTPPQPSQPSTPSQPSQPSTPSQPSKPWVSLPTLTIAESEKAAVIVVGAYAILVILGVVS